MEIINSEKFFYLNKCEVSFDVKSSRRIEKLSSNFLFTLNNIYFFLDSSDYKNKKIFEDTEMMERNLICKLSQDKIYITNYDEISRSIMFSHRHEDCQVIMDIKDMQLKDFKDFLNICLIFDGFKIMLEDMDTEYSSYQDYLHYIVDNIMSNGGGLVIDSEFFSIEELYLSNFVSFMSRIEKMTFKVNLKNVKILHMMKTVFCEIYDESYNLVDLKKNDLYMPKLSQLKILKFVDNKLNDDAFDLLCGIFEQTEFLCELEISNNHITNLSLMALSKKFQNKLKYLEKLIFCFNWIDSYMLDEFMKSALENLTKLKSIDLKGNYIDNEFLKKFDLNYLRKVYNKIHFNEILIDLSKNNFDNQTMQKTFYLWKIEEDSEKNERGAYTVENFLQNVFTFKLNLKFKFELVRHYKETKDFEVYKKLIDEGKCVKISCKTLNNEVDKIRSTDSSKGKSEIECYIQLFQIFYLLDQFFDPNLNNFNNKDINQNINLESGFINNSNIDQHYILLQQAITNITNSQLLNNSLNTFIHYQLTNNIQLMITHDYFKNNRNEIISQLFGKKSENFTPNFSIEDFSSFLSVIKSNPVEIPLIALHKYINRAKIDTLLTIKDKDIYSLNYLNEISNSLNSSYTEKVASSLNSLKEKSCIINEGLLAVLNFEGFTTNENNKSFYKEINNHLDLFIKEANSINFKNDLVTLAKYVQYMRNNKIRTELFNIYQNQLKEENLYSLGDKALSEFDMMYNKYKAITDYVTLRIPDGVKFKSLSLHPKRLDYLEISNVNVSDLEKDLKIVSSKLQEEESYGNRNIHDRIHFLLTQTSDTDIDEENKYHLHKQNSSLKLTRVLFRYFNNLDISSFKENYLVDYVIIQDIKDLMKEDNIDEDEMNKEKELNNSDKNSMISYYKLKSLSDRERLRKVEKNAREILDYKKKILTFSSICLKESLINSSNDLTKEWEDQFNSIAVKLNAKLYEIFDKNFYEDEKTIISMPQICKAIKEYVEFYFDIKDRYQKIQTKFYDLINQEIVFQLYRHINRNDFAQDNKILKYGLGLFTIMTFYLDLNSVIITALKKWMNYLINRGHFVDICEKIQNNFMNYSNKKIFWAPSIFEIEHRLENKEIILEVNFGGGYCEHFEIQEKTTISDLYEKILKESNFFRDIPEKRLYWIYIHHYTINESMPVFNEEYVLDIISFLENNSMLEFAEWEQNYNTYTAKYQQTHQNEEDDSMYEGYHERRKPKSFVFAKISFKIQRRLYSPYILMAEYSKINDMELLLLFEQIKYQFIKKELSILLADNDTVVVCAILIEDIRRSTLMDPTFSLDEFISSNLHKIMPEFKKNIINYKHDNFISQVVTLIEEKSSSNQTERELMEEFLKCFKNYGIFFSNIFDIRLISIHNTFNTNMYMPQKFLILISLDLVIFMDSNRFEIILKFSYEDIIYCTYISDVLYLAITAMNDNGMSNEIRFILRSDDARLIMEDIMSYSQLSLARKTQSGLTNCKVQEFQDEVVVCDLKDYKLVYQRRLPFMNNIPSISKELIEIQKNVTHTKFMRNSFILKNPSFFKRGSIETKRIPTSQKFLLKKEFSVNSLLKNRYGYNDECDPYLSDISLVQDPKIDNEENYKIDISSKNFEPFNSMSKIVNPIENKQVIITADKILKQTAKDNNNLKNYGENVNDNVKHSHDLAMKTSNKINEAMEKLPFKFLFSKNLFDEEN